MKRVLVAGATGYLGRHLCAEYQRRGWYVIALVRQTTQALPIAADQLIEAQARNPASLKGAMTGVDLVLSCRDTSRLAKGAGQHNTDAQANLNLLREAEQAGVGRFTYIPAPGAEQMRHDPREAPKSTFLVALQRSEIAATVVAPTASFADMRGFLDMAKSGRIWLIGDGSKRINPIHAADFATATAEATEATEAPETTATAETRGAQLNWHDIGGPEVFTQRELAELAFASLGKPARITCLPAQNHQTAGTQLSFGIPRHSPGSATFTLHALAHDRVAPPHGSHRLKDHFANARANAHTARIHQLSIGRKHP